MPQKRLYDPDVFFIFEEPGRKRMAERTELHCRDAAFLETRLEGSVKVLIFDTPACCGDKNSLCIDRLPRASPPITTIEQTGRSQEEG